MLPPDLARAISALGQRFDMDVARQTRALAIPMHDESGVASLPVLRDVAYGPDGRHRLDIYGAGVQGAGKPIVVFVHGGGFVAGDKASPDGAPFYGNVAAWAASLGAACVAMTYRLAPDHGYPAGAEDVAAAIAWLHAEGAAHGLDAGRIVLVGQSAGAVHVATYLASPALQLVKNGGVAAGVFLSGLYDMVAAADNPPKHAYFGTDASLYAERSSLEGLVEHCSVPLLVGVCEYDPPDFQSQALLLLNALFARDRRLPAVIYQARHNHLSSIFLLGSRADTLGGPLGDFVRQAVGNHDDGK
jgi:acetyl esterase/lipase